jgi:hypothetical protein
MKEKSFITLTPEPPRLRLRVDQRLRDQALVVPLHPRARLQVQHPSRTNEVKKARAFVIETLFGKLI